MTTTETGIVELLVPIIARALARSHGLGDHMGDEYLKPWLRDAETAARAAIAAMPDSTQLLQTMAECDALKHDVERQMTIANIECNEAERLRQILQTMAGAETDVARKVACGLRQIVKAMAGPVSRDRRAVEVLQDRINGFAHELEDAAQFRAQEQRS